MVYMLIDIYLRMYYSYNVIKMVVKNMKDNNSSIVEKRKIRRRKMVELLEEGYSQNYVAEKLGVCRKTIYNDVYKIKCEDVNFIRLPRISVTKKRKKDVLRLMKRSMKISDIAKEIGHYHNTVYKDICQLKKANEQLCKYSNCPARSKRREEVYEMFKGGLLPCEMAKRIGVSEYIVRNDVVRINAKLKVSLSLNKFTEYMFISERRKKVNKLKKLGKSDNEIISNLKIKRSVVVSDTMATKSIESSSCFRSYLDFLTNRQIKAI